MRYEAQFPAVRTSALNARRFVSEAIADVPEEVSDTIALIASELASNSVRHAASAFEIRIEQFPDRIHIEVEDDGGGEPIVKSPGPSDTSGRGLQIVTALADEWGVIPKGDSPGKTVWATIALQKNDDHIGARVGDDADSDERRKTIGRGTGAPGSMPRLIPVGQDRASMGVAPSLSFTTGPVPSGNRTLSRCPTRCPA
jgi:anti-sigma regulatory factor (Ser/Thr protein kinase)